MELTLDLEPGLDNRLRREAELRGIPAEEYALRVLHENVESPQRIDPLQLATSIYDGLDEEQVEEIEKIILQRRPLFERASVD